MNSKQILVLKELTERVNFLEKRNVELESRYDREHDVAKDIKERVKELKCMYEIAKTVTKESELEIILPEIIMKIPDGWQYPELVSSRIIIDGKEIISKEFVETSLVQSENIVVDRKIIGTLDVFYKEQVLDGILSPFLKEEQDLLEGIANIISMLVKQQRDREAKQLIKQQLLHTDRLATIGQLAAGVAHELNEPLANILGFAQLVLKDTQLSVQTSNDLTKIEEATYHAREIIRKLMEFSRQSIPRSDLFDFSDTIEQSIFFLESRCAKDGISLIKKYQKGITISADPDQLKQVVTNLVINAIQATGEDGQIIIETKEDSGNAILLVSDNGKGISSKHIEKIFMPFFTTKDVGEGTGLGLSVVYGIIKNHFGDIKVSSQKGKGATFQVTFPLSQAQTEVL